VPFELFLNAIFFKGDRQAFFDIWIIIIRAILYLNCRALKQKTNEKKGFDHLFSNDFIITIIISHVGLFYFWNLNGSSVPPPCPPPPPQNHALFLRAVSLFPCPFCLPSIFFPSQKKIQASFKTKRTRTKKIPN
jgi:hypothetical protein